MTDKPRWTCDRRIASRIEEGCHLIKEFVTELGNAGWEEPDAFGVHLAFEEAIMNAIKHGNKQDPNKQVRVSIAIWPKVVEIRIEDQGSGFDPDDLPDPTDDDHVENESGRGVMLIRHFMDDVEFNDCGNCVLMRKSK